jgi:hypothetical protein
MKKYILYFLLLSYVFLSLLSCKGKNGENNDGSNTLDKLKINSAIIDEYGKLMPGCKNLVGIECSGLDIAKAEFDFDDEGGKVEISKDSVFLIPELDKDKIKLNIKSGKKSGSIDFEVADSLPEPQIRFFNAETNEIQDYEIENISTVIVEVVADDVFAELFPEDSKYRITSYDAVLMRNDEELKSTGVIEEYDSNQINISTLQDVAKEGDNIVIRVLAIQRKNYEGKWLDISVPAKLKEVKLELI